MPTLSTRLLTAEEFARRPRPEDGSREELVHGEIVTMPPASFRHGEVATQIAFLLNLYLKDKNIGRAISETGVRTDRRPDSVRGPDVAFWTFKRLPRTRRVSTYPKVAADLCVEVRSPSNTLRKLRDKTTEYLRSGVRMVWIVDARGQTVTVYRPDTDPRTLTIHDVLDGDDVVPGFSCQVSELFKI